MTAALPSNIFRKLRKKIFGRWIQARERKAAMQTRHWEWKGISITVLPGVFHPGLFFSTELLLEVLSGEKLSGKKFLELGCGSGLISVYAAKQGAQVTASDISANAIECAGMNATRNKVSVHLLQSDLWDAFPSGTQFDFIIINPPYYPKEAKAEWEHAWFCGEQFQYFTKLFNRLHEFASGSARVLMVLSEDCDFERIKETANQAKCNFLLVQEQKKSGERTLVWALERG